MKLTPTILPGRRFFYSVDFEETPRRVVVAAADEMEGFLDRRERLGHNAAVAKLEADRVPDRLDDVAEVKRRRGLP